MEPTAEKKAQIIEFYNRGDKTTVIQLEFGISPADMYRVLHQAKVQLRSPRRLRHPQSSNGENPGHGPPARPCKKLRVPVVKKLIQLSHEEVAYFKSLCEDKVRQYGPGSEYDSWMEAWIEYTDDLVTRLEAWMTTLGDDAGGIVLGLVAFTESLEAINRLEPKSKSN